MRLYLDTTGENACVGVIVKQEVELILTGVEVHIEPAEYRCLAGPFADNDLHFWFSDGRPELSLYTVPKTQLCGYDSRGGYFAAMEHFSLREPRHLYYITPELQCMHITDDARKFREPFPDWREGMTPSDAIEVFSCRAEAEEKYDIKELRDLLEEDL